MGMGLTHRTCLTVHGIHLLKVVLGDARESRIYVIFENSKLFIVVILPISVKIICYQIFIKFLMSPHFIPNV